MLCHSCSDLGNDALTEERFDRGFRVVEELVRGASESTSQCCKGSAINQPDLGQRQVARKSARWKVSWGLLCVRRGQRRPRGGPDIDSLDLLFDRGAYAAPPCSRPDVSPVELRLKMSTNARAGYTGFSQVTRTNGVCHLPIANEFL